MTDTAMAALPSAGGEKPRNLVATGVAIACAGSTMFFGALLAAYIELRAYEKPWPPEHVELDLYFGNMLVITMLLGSWTVQWAVSAVKRGELRQASAAFAITMGFGVAFLNLLSYSAGRADFGAGEHAYGAVVAALALSIGVLVAAAVGFALFTMLRVRGSQIGPDNPDQAWAAAWFWHFATVASIVVWFAVVVRK